VDADEHDDRTEDGGERIRRRRRRQPDDERVAEADSVGPEGGGLARVRGGCHDDECAGTLSR
jgi:hypothetical protein